MPQDPNPSAARPPFAPLALRVAFAVVALKLLVLAMPPLGLSPLYVAGNIPGLPGFEEWRRGMAAEEWLRGPLLPYLDHQLGHFQGGTLLTIALATVAFALLGPSPFAMRLPNVLFDVAGALAVVWLVDRCAGRRAARYTAVFAALASPGYWVVGAAAWASHVESNGQVLALTAVWAAHVFYGARGARVGFGVGVLAGLALWYHYGALLWLLVLLLVELIHAPRAFASRAMLARSLGFVVGLSPWVVYNLRYDWAGLGLYGRSAEQHVQLDVTAALEKLRSLWSVFLPGSVGLPDAPGVLGSGHTGGVVLVGAAAVAWAAAAWRVLRDCVTRRATSPLLVFVLQPPLWALAYAFSELSGDTRWAQGYRYMLAVHPAAWALGGVACAGVAARGALAARATAVVVTAVGAVLLVALGATLRPDHLPLSFAAPGRNVETLGRFLFHRRLDSPDVLVEAARRVIAERDPVEADCVLFTLGNTLAFQLSVTPGRDEDPLRVEALERARAQAEAARAALASAVPPAFQPYFAPMRPGERPWPWSARDKFWRQWDARGEGRPAGAYAH